MLYPTCTTLFFSGFLTWLKMDLRSCTLYYNFTSTSKTLEMPFQCTKIKKQVSGSIAPDLPNLESVPPPPHIWDGLTPLGLHRTIKQECRIATYISRNLVGIFSCMQTRISKNINLVARGKIIFSTSPRRTKRPYGDI